MVKTSDRIAFFLAACLLATVSGCSGYTPTAASQEQSTASEVASPAPTNDPYQADRQVMLETIRGYGVSNEDVLNALFAVPRHTFVTADYLDQAYDDHPLPIGYGQTISQPFIVAWMTELLDLHSGEKVLEIGTGSGYQAAVLAELGQVEVYSIEIVPQLAEQAAGRLSGLGYENLHTKQGDGYFGWEEFAPFDAIIVTAAPDHLPPPLSAQLAEGGHLVIPIGPPGGYQTLWKFTLENGELRAENLGGVFFVPFTGQGIEGSESVPVP